MIIDIRNVPEGHSEVSKETDCGDYKADLPPLAGKIACVAIIDRKGPELFIHLTFKGQAEQECSRCLNPVQIPFEGETRLVAMEHTGKFGVSLDDEAVDFFYNARNQYVDLNSAIYDEIMTTLPVKPLCSPDCPGIIIGQESRIVVEDNKKIDPRWDALKKLKND